MPNSNKLITVLDTLLHSWGGDTPREAVWTFNELTEYLAGKHDLSIPELPENFSEADQENIYDILRSL